MELKFILNGSEVEENVEATEALTDVLRVKFGLTSVKKGCETGDCGSCAVLIDGTMVASCITIALTVSGKNVTTVEGLLANGEMDVIQKTIADFHGTQCGYCTPGMVIAIKALLNHNSHPTEPEIRRAISGNLCRCTGYQKIVEAVESITA